MENKFDFVEIDDSNFVISSLSNDFVQFNKLKYASEFQSKYKGLIQSFINKCIDAKSYGFEYSFGDDGGELEYIEDLYCVYRPNITNFYLHNKIHTVDYDDMIMLFSITDFPNQYDLHLKSINFRYSTEYVSYGQYDSCVFSHNYSYNCLIL